MGGNLPAETTAMNRILFEEHELLQPLASSDPRLAHIRKILKLETGREFLAGIVNGPVGRARLIEEGNSALRVDFIAEALPPPLLPLSLVLGCPRPPVARRILKDITSIGIRDIRVCHTDLNEKSYLTSKLWRDGLWREAVIEGAVQASSSLIPTVGIYPSLEKAMESIPENTEKICLDYSEGSIPFTEKQFHSDEACLAIGPERGWSAREVDLLHRAGFSRLHLGKRILRTETACAVGAGLVLDRMGLF